jgi:hypothetical protein
MSNRALKSSNGKGTKMSIVLRSGTPPDASVCGPICFEAFKAIDDEHNFTWDFPSAAVATDLLTMMLSNPGFYSVVAENEGMSSAATFSTNADLLPASGRSRLIRRRRTRRSGAN